jgi:hypothetical protein
MKSTEVTTPKDKAALLVLVLLRSPLVLMSRQNREVVLTQAREHGISAEDLIFAALKSAKRA